MGTLGTLLFAIVGFMVLMIVVIVFLFVFFGAKWLMGERHGLSSAELKLLREQFAKKAAEQQEAALAAKLKEIAPK